jgi:hypothetical protein
MQLGKGRGLEVCDNVQTAVDNKPQRLSAHDGTHDTHDRAWLSPLALQAQDLLGGPFDAVAAVGSSHGEEGKTCRAAGLTPSVARPLTSAQATLGLVSTEDCSYDQVTATDRCPAHARRTLRLDAVEPGRHSR